MGLGLALALAAALGIIAVRLLRGAADERLLGVFLGVGCGLGMTSVAWFVWLVLLGPPGNGLLDVRDSGARGSRVAPRCSPSRLTDSSPPSTDRRPSWLLLVALALVVGSSLVAFVVTFLGEPHGHWDAAQIGICGRGSSSGEASPGAMLLR